MKKQFFLSMSVFAVIFTGCSTTNEELSNSIEKSYKPYNLVKKGIYGDRFNDNNALIDNGVVLKAWVNSYKNKYGSLVASHDILVRVKEPDINVNYAKMPSSFRSATLTDAPTVMPFNVTNNEMDSSSKTVNDSIATFVDPSKIVNVESEIKKEEDTSEIDERILNFINDKSLK